MERLQVVGYSSCRTKVLLASPDGDGEMYWVSASGLVRMLGHEGLLPERRSRSAAAPAPVPPPPAPAPLPVPELTAFPAPRAPEDEPTGEFPAFDNYLDAWAGFVRRKGA